MPRSLMTWKPTRNRKEQKSHQELTEQQMSEGFVQDGEQYPGVPVDDYEGIMWLFEDIVGCCDPKTENVRQPGEPSITKIGAGVVRRTMGSPGRAPCELVQSLANGFAESSPHRNPDFCGR
jgi:hypothetical protein